MRSHYEDLKTRPEVRSLLSAVSQKLTEVLPDKLNLVSWQSLLYCCLVFYILHFKCFARVAVESDQNWKHLHLQNRRKKRKHRQRKKHLLKNRARRGSRRRTNVASEFIEFCRVSL